MTLPPSLFKIASCLNVLCVWQYLYMFHTFSCDSVLIVQNMGHGEREQMCMSVCVRVWICACECVSVIAPKSSVFTQHCIAHHTTSSPYSSLLSWHNIYPSELIPQAFFPFSQSTVQYYCIAHHTTPSFTLISSPQPTSPLQNTSPRGPSSPSTWRTSRWRRAVWHALKWTYGLRTPSCHSSCGKRTCPSHGRIPKLPRLRLIEWPSWQL